MRFRLVRCYIFYEGSKIEIRVYEIKLSAKQAISKRIILETLFPDTNLSRNNQHKNKTLLAFSEAKTGLKAQFNSAQTQIRQLAELLNFR